MTLRKIAAYMGLWAVLAVMVACTGGPGSANTPNPAAAAEAAVVDDPEPPVEVSFPPEYEGGDLTRSHTRLPGFKVLAYEWDRIIFQMPDEIPVRYAADGDRLEFRVRVRIYHHSRSHGYAPGWRRTALVPANVTQTPGGSAQANIKNHWTAGTDEAKKLQYTLAYASAYVEGGFYENGRFNRVWTSPRKTRTEICAYHWREKRSSDWRYPNAISFFDWNGQNMASWGWTPRGAVVRTAWTNDGELAQMVPVENNWDLGPANKRFFNISVTTSWTDYLGDEETCQRARLGVLAAPGRR